jgi:glycosyltransferase involved in cell wall biosynthesis
MDQLSSKMTPDPIRMRDRMRIAFVITELEPGGAEKCLVELATRLDRARYAPVVYSLGPRPPAGRQLFVQSLLAADVPTHFLDFCRPLQYFAAVRRLSALLVQQQPEIVQTFLFHANVIGARAARRAGVRRLATGIRVADPRRWRTIVERWTTAQADHHVCVSQGVAEFCRRQGFANEKLVVIPNGIDVARWRDARSADLRQFGIPAGRRAIVYVGRLEEQKGLDRLFLALPNVFAKIPLHDLLVAGEGELHDTLKRMAERLGVSDRVHISGWQSDVPSILRAADLLVLPSKWEGMPNAILEAMAAGKPVVATLAEGVSELLGTRENPQTLPLGCSSQDLAARIIEIVRNPLLVNDLGKENQRRAEQAFSLDSMVNQYSNLYESLAVNA